MKRSSINKGYRKAVSSIAIVVFFALLCSPAFADKYTKTKHPVVLVHGFLGFDTALGVDYWYGIAAHLRRGGSTVFTSNQSSVNGAVERGEQLIVYLDEIKAIYGFKKFNLIGHSQGGFESRYVASVRPDLVASVTAVGSPLTGSGFGEFLVSTTANDPVIQNIIYAGLNIFGSLIELLANDNDPQDALKAGSILSYAGAAEFNEQHPQAMPKSRCAGGKKKVNGIRYYSFTGIKPFNNFFDPSDYVMALTGAFEQNDLSDGLAGQCASHLGKVIRDDYAWNHVDEVNQLFGVQGWGAANPLSVYRSHVHRLKKRGL